MTYSEFLSSPLRPANQRGIVFIDALHAAGKHTLANALAYSNFDPFGKPNVSPEALAFCQRNW